MLKKKNRNFFENKKKIVVTANTSFDSQKEQFAGNLSTQVS